LTIISGSEGINIERYNQRRIHLSRPWNGTFVGLLLELNNPLPLDEIYSQAIEASVGGRNSSPTPPSPPPVTTVSPIVETVITEIAIVRYGDELLTREMGISVRADIATALARGDVVKVVLDGVIDMTPSVADECFGKLAESLGREAFDKRIILAGGAPLMSRLIELVVNNRIQSGQDMP
jgi:hypothetical protein